MKSLRIGTRGSKLALWQARWVEERLREAGFQAEMRVIQTEGDRNWGVPLQEGGVKGVFVREIEQALLRGEIDLAVHSMKDLPAEMPPGLALAAVPERGDTRDVLVSREGISLQCLPSGARLGTSSLRRQAQILSLRPDLQAVAVRGNVDTRLRKLRSSNLDGLVLAAAGLERLGSLGQVTEFLTEELFLPAPGQGAMGIESRAAERDLFSFLGDETARTEVEAERAFLSRLQGGCRVPIGARARFSSRSRLHLKGVVLSVDGRQRMASEEEGDAREPQRIGSVLAERILALGGAALLEGIR